MESSLSEARSALKDAIARFEAISPVMKLDQPLTLNAVTPFPQTLESTIGREVGVIKPCGMLSSQPCTVMVRRTARGPSLVHGMGHLLLIWLVAHFTCLRRSV